MERKYVAFISYRHAQLDSAVAKQLHTLIEQYRIPKNLRGDQKRLGTVFRDQEELPVSSDLSEDICKALDNAQYLIVVCSTNTAQSPWVSREIEYFLSHHDRQRVFTVLASGEPVDVFPSQLTHIQNPDGTVTEVEPLAVDVRADSISGMTKKLRREIYRLYAAMLGCPYDALVQREQRRKRRQLAAVLSVVFAVVLSFMGLMLAKNYEIDQKNQALEGMNQELEDINAQLEEKNDALAEQKAEVQLRESELLTEEAIEKLEQGNTLEAVRHAVQALPKPGDERPYYAAAEKALIESLGAFSADAKAYSVVEVTLKQRTPVKDYSMREDGTRLATIDEYNVVNCYDTATGEQVWSYQLSDAAYTRNMELHAYPQADAVIAYSGNWIAAFSYETGIPMWTHKTESASVAYVDAQRGQLAYINGKVQFGLEEGQQTTMLYTCVFLDLATGEVKQEIPIIESAWAMDDEMPYAVFTDTVNYTVTNGAFSNDGSLFAGSYVVETRSEYFALRYYIIDIASGEILCQYEEDLKDSYYNHTPLRMGFTVDDKSVLVIRNHPESRVPATLDLWDYQTNQLRWRRELPELEQYISGEKNPVGLLNEARLYLACQKQLYVLDLQTGEVLSRNGFESHITALEWVDGFMGVVFDSGRYTVGWRNDSGVFFADRGDEVAVDLGENTKAKLWNEGFIKLVVADGQAQGLNLDDPDAERGYAAVVPVEDPNCVKIKRYSYLGKIVIPQKAVEMDPDYYLSSRDVRQLNEDLFVFGPISDWSADETRYHFGIFNMQTGQTEYLTFDKYTEMDDIFLLRDGSGYISSSGYLTGDLILTDRKTGEVTTIYENVTTTVNVNENLIQEKVEYIHDSARLKETSQILSVRLGNGELTWWLDGRQEQSVKIPQDITAEVIHEYGAYRSLGALANGVILVGDYRQTDTVERIGLGLFETTTGNWYKLPNADMVMTDANKSCVGLLTDEQMFILYDYVQEKAVYQFSTQLPQNSVYHAVMFLENQYLAIKTKDLQFLIYEIATGEIVYADQMGGYSGAFRIYPDAQGQRLFVCDNDSSTKVGFYIHIGSWTKLADIPGLMFYDARRNEAFCYFDNWAEKWEGIIRFAIPSTEELVAKGQQYLGE